LSLIKNIVAKFSEFFRGNLNIYDVVLYIYDEDDNMTAKIVIPDIAVFATEDSLRSDRLEMLPENILHRMFKKNSRFVLRSESEDGKKIHDEVNPGKWISELIYEYLMRVFREARTQ